MPSKHQRLLALAVYPVRSAATRFRVGALRESLAERNIELTLATSLDERGLEVLYRPGKVLTKAMFAARSTLAQWTQSLAGGPWDAVLVQREAGLIGPPALEWLLRSAGGLPLIFDFDDAIWLPSGSASANPTAARFLKMPSKTWWLMRKASHLIAGSEHLAAIARSHNANVTVVPTVVSRDQWKPIPGRLEGEFASPDEPVIGFIGTHSTAQHLHLVVPALQRLRDEGRRFRLRVVGAGPDLKLQFDCDYVPWTLDRETELFQGLDIGIAPLPDDQWTRGKCAFKQIQYLAVGVPCVTSPVGAAADLVAEGLALPATTTEDWFRALRRLLDTPSLRARLAQSGRKKIEAHLCSEIQSARAADVILAALSSRRTAATRSPSHE